MGAVSKSVVATSIFAIAALMTAGCGQSSSGSNGGPVQRDFTQTLSVEGKEVLKVVSKYVGKKPGDPEKFESKHDYRAIDTDFYRIEFSNLTDSPITIERVDYRMERGGYSGQPYSTAESIRQTWGNNLIEPKAKLSRANNMVWAKGTRNTLYKTYTFSVLTESGAAEELKAEVPLVYAR